MPFRRRLVGCFSALLAPHVPHQFRAGDTDAATVGVQNRCGMLAATASPARTALPAAHFDRNDTLLYADAALALRPLQFVRKHTQTIQSRSFST